MPGTARAAAQSFGIFGALAAVCVEQWQTAVACACWQAVQPSAQSLSLQDEPIQVWTFAQEIQLVQRSHHSAVAMRKVHADECMMGRTWLVGSPAGMNVLNSLLQQKGDAFTRAATCFQLLNNAAPQDVLEDLCQTEPCTGCRISVLHISLQAIKLFFVRIQLCNTTHTVCIQTGKEKVDPN